jgi:hypothetical protein
MTRPNAIQKILSLNDSGETGGHQSGILIPRREEILSFFPELSKKEKNPRIMITFSDDLQQQWMFSYIYYNNRFYGGTRNEFRLTRMTRYMRQHNLKAGDVLTLRRDTDSIYTVEHTVAHERIASSDKVLKLGDNWKVVSI